MANEKEEQTTEIKIRPEMNPQLISYFDEAVKLLDYAEARVIAATEDLEAATNDLSIIANLKRALEEKRKEYIKPLQDHLKGINDTFKMLMAPIETADQITRKKILAFQAEQERIRQEQFEINRLRTEAAQKEAALHGGEISEPVQLVEVGAAAPKRISTDMGTVGQRMITKWEVLNFSQVPDEFKVIDSAKVTKLVKGGGSIPGIRVWQEPILAVKARLDCLPRSVK